MKYASGDCEPISKIGTLQALRAYAALWVAFSHSGHPNLYVGTFGVDIFFVLSGFIMTLICAAESMSPARFLSGRLARIVPLYWLMTFVMFTMTWFAPRLFATGARWTDLVESLMFIPHFKENGKLMPVLSPGWTLNYEMLFYAIVAVCLVWPRRWATLVAAVVVAILAVATPASVRTTAVGAFCANPIIAEFILGVVAFYVWRRIRLSGPAVLAAASVAAGCCAVLVVVERWNLQASVPTGRLLAFGLPAFFIVVGCSAMDGWRPFSTLIANRVTLALGDASYSIYLTHVFVIEGLHKIVYPRTGLFDMSTAIGALSALVAVALCGLVVHRVIERPLIAGARSFLAGSRAQRGLIAAGSAVDLAKGQNPEQSLTK